MSDESSDERVSPSGRLWRRRGKEWLPVEQQLPATGTLAPDGLSRWDGTQWVPLSAEERQARLQARVHATTSRGWRVIDQTPTTAQLVYPKVFSAGWAIFWFFFGCGIGLPIYFFYWLGKRDATAYLTADDAVPQGVIRR